MVLALSVWERGTTHADEWNHVEICGVSGTVEMEPPKSFLHERCRRPAAQAQFRCIVDPGAGF